MLAQVWILGIQTGQLRNLRFLRVISKPDENASSPKIKSKNSAKKIKTGGLIFQLADPKLSVSHRRPEFQCCLQILILFTNSIYKIEAQGKLKPPPENPIHALEWGGREGGGVGGMRVDDLPISMAIDCDPKMALSIGGINTSSNSWQ